MATLLSTLASSSIKVRWQEPYVSEALNKKTVSAGMGHGVVRGGLLKAVSGTTPQVSVDGEDYRGVVKSVFSYIYQTGSDEYHLHIETGTSYNLDLTPVAGTKVYIALHAEYTVGSASTAAFYALTDADLASPTHKNDIILGVVDVPASGGITTSNISYTKRMIAALNPVAGMEDGWVELLGDPGFIKPFTDSSGKLFAPHMLLSYSAGFEFALDGTNKVAGEHAFVFKATTGGAPSAYAEFREDFSAQNVSKLFLSFYMSSVNIPAGGANARYGVSVRFFDQSNTLLSEEFLGESGSSYSGDNAYSQYSAEVEVPASASMVKVRFVVESDGGSWLGLSPVEEIRWSKVELFGLSKSQKVDRAGATERALGWAKSIVSSIIPSNSLTAFTGSRNPDRYGFYESVSSLSFGSSKWIASTFRQLADYSALHGVIRYVFGELLYMYNADSYMRRFPMIGLSPFYADAAWSDNTRRFASLFSFDAKGTRFRVIIDRFGGDGSSFTSSYGVWLTANAYWDEAGGAWARDDASKGAYAFVCVYTDPSATLSIVDSVEVSFMKLDTVTGSWNKLVSSYADDSFKGVVHVNQPIQVSATSGYLHSVPVSLNPSTVPRAWGKILYDPAGTPKFQLDGTSNDHGYNVSSVSDTLISGVDAVNISFADTVIGNMSVMTSVYNGTESILVNGNPQNAASMTLYWSVNPASVRRFTFLVYSPSV